MNEINYTMYYSTRRDFLKTATGLLALTFAPPFSLKKDNQLLSFSTLGCPDWTFQAIVNFAADNDYNGIELRGIRREMDLTKCPEFNSAENINACLKIVKDKGLKFVDLGSSAELHHSDIVERKRNLDEAKSFIDLAQQLQCPYIRVFPNSFPKNQERDATIDLIIKGLIELGDYAKEKNVTVLMETHGDLVQSEDLKKIMESSSHSHVGLVWDSMNMWSITKEPPAQAYEKLKQYIFHAHIKDLRFVDGKIRYELLGKGESPIFEAMEALSKGGYKGYYSFEWEKMWHPEIEEPEIALADYPKTMRQHFKK